MGEKRNVIYAQSGGVTTVINTSACGVIETVRKHPDRFGKIYAGLHGIIGILQEELIDVDQESDEAIAGLRYTPGGAFGSCRYKLKGLEESRREYERLIEVFDAYDIGYFFYNGGGDSADTCYKVAQLAEKLGYPIQAIHVPKTMDNDLPITDCSPGFGSAAKYVAVSTREVHYDVASTFTTSTRVFILEVMGRHAGWTAAAAGLASTPEDPIPLLILFPEIPFEEDRFLAKVDEKVREAGYCIVVASEGIRKPDGSFVSEMGTRDAFGHAQLGGVAPRLAEIVRGRLGYKFHFAVSDYLLRAARHLSSKVDVEQAYAVGRAAVEFALQGKNAVMPAIKRLSDDPYRWEIVEAPLSEVANVEKKMPREFISEDGFGITEACRRYMQPLIEGEDFPPFERGLPRYTRLKRVMVEKRLPEFKVV